MLRLVPITLCCFLMAGCSDRAEKNVATEEAIEAVTEKKANNPFAKEQSFMKEAAMVQGILDQDAEEKKKAVEEATKQ